MRQFQQLDELFGSKLPEVAHWFEKLLHAEQGNADGNGSGGGSGGDEIDLADLLKRAVSDTPDDATLFASH